MAKYPLEYKAAAEAAEKELPRLKEERAALGKEVAEFDRRIMLAETMIDLWRKVSGQPSLTEEIGLGTAVSPEAPKAEPVLHEVIADILRDGRTRRVKEIVKEVSSRRGRPASVSTVYSAILRKPEKFEKKGNKYRLKPQTPG